MRTLAFLRLLRLPDEFESLDVLVEGLLQDEAEGFEVSARLFDSLQGGQSSSRPGNVEILQRRVDRRSAGEGQFALRIAPNGTWAAPGAG